MNKEKIEKAYIKHNWMTEKEQGEYYQAIAELTFEERGALILKLSEKIKDLEAEAWAEAWED